jgi:dihydroflavonol-4-reductase
VLRDAVERPAQRTEPHRAVHQRQQNLEFPFAAKGMDRVLEVVKQRAPQLGRIRHLSAAKARRLLGWTPRGNGEIIVATAESLLRLGLVKP